jgi:metal-sulfur cluster biosynthetic enzyme
MRARLLEQLNKIVDPCSIATALPAGLVDMGLVRTLNVRALPAGGIRVDVALTVTHAFCMMSGVFVNEVETLLRGDRDVTEFEVTLDAATLWTEELMTPGYRARLEAQRTRKGLR